METHVNNDMKSDFVKRSKTVCLLPAGRYRDAFHLDAPPIGLLPMKHSFDRRTGGCDRQNSFAGEFVEGDEV
jgi:hypothetical protein